MRAVDIPRLLLHAAWMACGHMSRTCGCVPQLMQELMPNARGSELLVCSVWVVKTMVRLEAGCALVVTHAQLYSLLSPCITNNGGGGRVAQNI